MKIKKAGDDINWSLIEHPWTPSTSQLYRQDGRFEVIDAARLNQLFAERPYEKGLFVTVLSACGTEKVIIAQSAGFLFNQLEIIIINYLKTI